MTEDVCAKYISPAVKKVSAQIEVGRMLMDCQRMYYPTKADKARRKIDRINRAKMTGRI